MKMELLIKCATLSDFERMATYFEVESSFCPETQNMEFKSLGFEVADQDEADNLETAIENELNANEVDFSYFFESE